LNVILRQSRRICFVSARKADASLTLSMTSLGSRYHVLILCSASVSS
jgi:hypothetical protein